MYYRDHEFKYVDKTIYMDGMKIWFDADNQIGDPQYYDTFEEWVIDNTDYIEGWEAKWKVWCNDNKVRL